LLKFVHLIGLKRNWRIGVKKTEFETF
jgi:hypothetical protein